MNYERANHCDFCLTRVYFKDTLIDIKSIENTCLDKRLYLDIFPIDNVPECQVERASFEQKVIKMKRIIGMIDVRIYERSSAPVIMKKFVSLLLMPFRPYLLKKNDTLIKKYRCLTTNLVCSICSQYSFAKQVMPRNFYGEPKLHSFVDTEFYIPENVHDYLAQLYGNDYMQIPSENKRRKGHDIYICSE